MSVREIPWRIDTADALPESLCGLRDAIEQLTYDVLGHHQGGWQDNDGSYGEFILDVTAQLATLEFNARFTDSVYSAHTI